MIIPQAGDRRIAYTGEIEVMSAVFSSYQRPGPSSLDARIKANNYLTYILAFLEAQDRGADIALLARSFIDRYSREHIARVRRIHPAAMDALSAYAWPGNVRELQGVLERAVLLAAGPVLEIGPDVLPLSPPTGHGGHCAATLEEA